MKNSPHSYDTIDVEQIGRVVTIRFNRPDALNALNTQVMEEVLHCAMHFDTDPDVGCFVIAGSDRAFAAGAAISE